MGNSTTKKNKIKNKSKMKTTTTKKTINNNDISMIKKLEDELVKLRYDLEEEKKKNDDLNKKLLNKNESLTLVSKEKVKTFVDSLLTNENVNISMFPDAIEKQLYMNVLNILMEIMKETFKGVRVEIMGHEIKTYMQPIISTDKKKEG